MIILSLVCLCGLILFIVPMFRDIINIGNVSGSIFFTLALLIIEFSDFFIKIIKYLYSYSVTRIILIFLIIVFLVLIALAIVFSVLMIKAIYNYPKKQNVLVVLGCRVKGEKPTRMLMRRLDAAKKYMDINSDVLCVVSGGRGENENISEALAMKTYLINNEISEQRIIMEDKSTSTYENLKFSGAIIKKAGLGNDITIVTDGYHQFRSAIIAKRLGLTSKSLCAHTRAYLIPTYWVREWFCIVNEILFK